MKVFLVQHAEAKTEEEDPGRHLTEKGVQDARNLGKVLAERKIIPSAFWHSGKTRSLETAKTMASFFDKDIPFEEMHGMAPNDHPGPVADQLKDGVMVVGHMPFLSKMVARMISGHEKAQVATFDYARCACLAGDGKRWIIEWMLDPAFIKIES